MERNLLRFALWFLIYGNAINYGNTHCIILPWQGFQKY